MWRGQGRGSRSTDRRTPGFRLRTLLLALAVPGEADATTIRDYQEHLNTRFAKRPRQDTRFILIHSTECGLSSALRTLSQGKRLQGRHATRGGHAHYLVARDGAIYRILDPKYRADHAGVSMWNGIEDLSDHSLGIELEGFHDVAFTAAQYRSLSWLIGVLRRRFDIASRDVLEHYRVAYTSPNRFHSRNMRGRKRDPGRDNFDRRRAGLGDKYAYDPDVVAGRVGKAALRREDKRTVAVAAPRRIPSRVRLGVITRGRSAWSIAGTRYRDATTLYVLPDATIRRGSEVRKWTKLPSGTVVQVEIADPVAGVVSPNRSAWSIARDAYDSPGTLYALPDGATRRGHEIADWSRLSSGTRVYLNAQLGRRNEHP
ncbi:MAG TPA: N-acetylmuramoyl-L-alanine amidase [Vicinamibacteria bacterium]|nr:N-acetylmuramoyl-L-alanine amidase [Vicinamibacteria bacterium]